VRHVQGEVGCFSGIFAKIIPAKRGKRLFAAEFSKIAKKIEKILFFYLTNRK
jgi:hypothetical protein